MLRQACLVLSLFLSGCVLHHTSTASVDGLSGRGDAQAFAAEAATELQERHAPAQTPLVLRKAPGLFGDALESELRGRGFALVEQETRPDVLEVTYTADVLDGQGFVQMRCANDAFSFSRPLGSPVRSAEYTEPPSQVSARGSQGIQSRPLPEPTAVTSVPTSPAAEQATVATVPVRSTATAMTVARRNGVPVADFCRWNQVGTSAVLEKGYQVYLSEPPAGISPTAAPVPVPPGVEAILAAEKGTPPPVAIPDHTSAKLSLDPNPLTRKAVYEPAPIAEVALEKEAIRSPAPLPGPAALPAAPAAEVVVETLEAALPVWEISQGRMLRGQMQEWADQAGYNLIWNAQNDYELKSSASFPGVFIEAVRDCFSALQANGLALRVTIYQGNRVMEVAEQ